MQAKRFDILILGSGFGGSLMAMVAQRLGFQTGLVERGKHPRFAIGESTTPLTNLLLGEIAREYELPGIAPLCKWGTWQKAVPNLGCGLKRGFTFYHHDPRQPLGFTSDPQRQLLVGASPNEEVADTHWYRPDFDQYLVQQAQALGVEYLEETELTQFAETAEDIHIRGRQRSTSLELSAKFVIDATGPRGFLYHTLKLPENPLPLLPPTQALFSHFRGVETLPECRLPDGRTPPYPHEDAAVHHVFPGGWVWVLRFNNGITSAGAAVTDSLAQQLDFQLGAAGWDKLMQRLPALAAIFAPAKAVVPFTHQPRLAFHCGRLTGRRWALLPSAGGIVDPLLSTGFPLNLLGITRLARIVKTAWARPAWERELREYEQTAHLELETTARLVGALYYAMERFDLFKALSLLYFTAAGFSEISRRLGKPELASHFLLCGDPEFSPELKAICEAVPRVAATDGEKELKRRIMKLIAPFDLAGLTDGNRDPWYPARLEDILHNSAKLHATPAELEALFVSR